MLMRTLRVALAALLTIGATASMAQQATAENQQKHEEAKQAGSSWMNDLMEAFMPNNGSSNLMPGVEPGSSASQRRKAAKAAGEAELAVLLCYQEVRNRQITTELSENCKGVVNPNSVGSGIGFSPGSTNGTSIQVLYLCIDVLSTGQGVGGKLHKHCDTLVNAYIKMYEQTERRDGEVATTQQALSVQPQHTSSQNLSRADLTNSYSACGTTTQTLSDEVRETETCSIERVQSRGNTCTKTLRTNVTWACPSGAVSGPTRVRAGTTLMAGQYTCGVEVPRNVYSCPAGWPAPSVLPIPPGNQSGQACRNPADGSVQAATVTVVRDVVQQDATYNVAREWTGDCVALEASTPPEWRGNFVNAAVPMAPYNPSGAGQINFQLDPEGNRAAQMAAECARLPEPKPAQCRASGSTNRSSGNNTCRMMEATCTQTPAATVVINDVPVPPVCQAYRESFDCLTGLEVNHCDDNPSCRVEGDVCEETDNSTSPPTCRSRAITRSCVTQPAVTTEVETCANQTFCPNGLCYNTGSEPNTDMGLVAALLESGRQGGRYFNASDMEVFKGYPGRCRSKVTGGLFDCCKKNKLGEIFYKALHLSDGLKPGRNNSKDNKGKDMSSGQTLDFLFAADNSGMLASSVRAVDSMANEAKQVWGDMKDGDYKAAALKFFVTSPKKIAEDVGDTLFDMFTRLITLWGLLEGCDDEDRIVVEKKRSTLCVEVGRRCTTDTFLGCWERENRHCCFNSMLAKIINDEGRKQIMQEHPALGANLWPAGTTDVNARFGNVRALNCKGFNLEQLRALDFSRIDLRPFIATILPKDMATKAQRDAKKEDLVQRAMQMYANGCGGSGQCDGANPFDTVAANANTADGMSHDCAPGSPIDPATGHPNPRTCTKMRSLPKQYLSLRPLMFQAIANGAASGVINNEDIRMLAVARFRKDEVPLRADVQRLMPHPTFQGCFLMGVTLTRDAVTTFTRPVRNTKNAQGQWVEGGAPAGSTETVSVGGESATSIVDASVHNTSLTFCSDGRVPGASL